jgi:hypothetical protein
VCVSREDFSSPEYLKLPASAKFEALWEKITENQESLEFFSKFQVMGILFKDLWETFRDTADVFPEGRKKLLHTKGNIAKGELIITKSHPYTGIFKGCKNLFIRLSAGKNPDVTKTTAKEAYKNFVPGMGIKFLRDGVPSANLQAMFNVAGQDSWNFFEYDFTTSFILPEESNFLGKLIGAKFSTITYNSGSIGIKDLAEYDENGVKESSPRYPYRLIFRPTVHVKDLFSDDYQQFYTEQLKTIPAGTDIYHVIAVDAPGCDEYTIGTLRMTTQLITSRFSDERLFFKHNLVDDDDKDLGWSKFRDYSSVTSGVIHGEQPQHVSGCPLASVLKLNESKSSEKTEH